jgi:hypothetical protein
MKKVISLFILIMGVSLAIVNCDKGIKSKKVEVCKSNKVEVKYKHLKGEKYEKKTVISIKGSDVQIIIDTITSKIKPIDYNNTKFIEYSQLKKRSNQNILVKYDFMFYNGNSTINPACFMGFYNSWDWYNTQLTNNNALINKFFKKNIGDVTKCSFSDDGGNVATGDLIITTSNLQSSRKVHAFLSLTFWYNNVQQTEYFFVLNIPVLPHSYENDKLEVMKDYAYQYDPNFICLHLTYGSVYYKTK